MSLPGLDKLVPGKNKGYRRCVGLNPNTCEPTSGISCASITLEVTSAASIWQGVVQKGRSSVVEQRPFKPKVVGSIPTAPTSFLIHSERLASFARQQKAALTAGQRRRASKISRHGWQSADSLDSSFVARSNNLGRDQSFSLFSDADRRRPIAFGPTAEISRYCSS